MSLDLSALEASARRRGWSTGSGSVNDIRIAGRALGWEEVPIRAGEHAVAELRPKDQQNASARSLSASYGVGAQPLHTDGAHLTHPPDLLVLCASYPNETPTLLWNRTSNPTSQLWRWNHLNDGIFLVNNGRDSFFTTAAMAAGIRYDPGCMVACDQRARKLARFFETAIEEAQHHYWTTIDQVLLIHNHKTLHARAAVSDTDRSRLLHRIAFNTRKLG
jgi:alpha-ketoglutarate-dependent taurine dioxygenase